MAERLVGGGGDDMTRGVDAEDVAYLGVVEAVGAQHLEEQLAVQLLGDVGLQLPQGEGAGGGHVALAEGLEEVVVELLDTAQAAGGGKDVAGGTGVDLLEEGQKLVTDAVATVAEGAVGDILDMREALAAGVALDVGTAEGEQRADDGQGGGAVGAGAGAVGGGLENGGGEDAVEPREACAAEQVEEECLGGIDSRSAFPT